MSLSVFYAIRFSPAPELGEWLNIAVVGEGISEHKAGIVVADSLDRIAGAFGAEAVERVTAISEDLTRFVAAMKEALKRGEETHPIPTAMRDVALTLSISDQIMVFEGTFDEALAAMAAKYLTPQAELQESTNQERRRIVADFGTDAQSLRDVSVSLNNVGRVREAARDWPAASAAYEESLEVRRRIVADFGADAQSLRDVSVSLDNVGRVREAARDWPAASAAYEESLEVSRRIVADFGADAQSLRDVSISLNNVGLVREAARDWPAASAAYEESLEVCRRIVADFGTDAQSLRDVSVSLNNVGRVREAARDWPAASAAYEESLEVQSTPETAKASSHEHESDLGDIFHRAIAQFSKDILPAAIAKSIEHGQKALGGLLRAPESSTVLVVGGAGHLGSALIPKLLANGKRVRLYEPSVSGATVYEILHPSAQGGFSISEVARLSGVSVDSVTQVLGGATERIRVSPKTADQIRQIASKLGYRADDPGFVRVHGADLDTSLDGVEALIYIPGAEEPGAALDIAQVAKARGVKRFVYADSLSGRGAALPLTALSDDHFAVTILTLGDLYGHSKDTQWFGDLHEDQPSVNALTARAVLNGKVTAVESGPRPFLHVEDAVAAVWAVLNAPAETAKGRTYTVGAEGEVRTTSEIAELIKEQVPDAEFMILMGEAKGEATAVHFSRITEDLGFTPSRTLQEAIRQLIAAIRDGTIPAYLAAREAKAEDASGSLEPDSLRDRLEEAQAAEPGKTTDQNVHRAG